MDLFVEVGYQVFSCINQNFSLYLNLIEWDFTFLHGAFCCTLLIKLLAECMPVTVES